MTFEERAMITFYRKGRISYEEISRTLNRAELLRTKRMCARVMSNAPHSPPELLEAWLAHLIKARASIDREITEGPISRIAFDIKRLDVLQECSTEMNKAILRVIIEELKQRDEAGGGEHSGADLDRLPDVEITK